MSIEIHEDGDWPGRYRVSIRGLDVWLTKNELHILHGQSGYVLANPLVKITKPIKLFQLFSREGAQK